MKLQYALFTTTVSSTFNLMVPTIRLQLIFMFRQQMSDILPTGDVMKESVTKGRPDQKTARKKEEIKSC
jgi:hypothetical protein